MPSLLSAVPPLLRSRISHGVGILRGWWPPVERAPMNHPNRYRRHRPTLPSFLRPQTFVISPRINSPSRKKKNEVTLGLHTLTRTCINPITFPFKGKRCFALDELCVAHGWITNLLLLDKCVSFLFLFFLSRATWWVIVNVLGKIEDDKEISRLGN